MYFNQIYSILLYLFIICVHFIFKIHSLENNINNNTEQNQVKTTCITGDGLDGFCSSKQNCSNYNNETILNCGLDSPANYICCPKQINQTYLYHLSLFKKTQCGKHPDFFNIVGGKETKPNFYPWVVAIYQVNNEYYPIGSSFTKQYYRFICGGTLISNQHVVSAAHCVKQKYYVLNPSNFLVKVGAHNLENSGKFYKVEKVFAHENYRGYQRYNDISLLKLSTQVQREIPFIVCLPTLYSLNQILKENTPLTIAGWGTTFFLGGLSKNLMTAEVKYIKNRECSKNYSLLEGSEISYPNGIDHTMICAGFREGGRDSCQGDSGGPLMYTDKQNNVFLVGIVSFGYRCAHAGFPGIYTKVPIFLNWIISKMNL